MNDTVTFMVYLLFGAIGFGYFIYGKRQSKVVPLICGVGLIVYPYFITNTVLLFVIGVVFLGLPYFIRY
jgi:hypothetical protein